MCRRFGNLSVGQQTVGLLTPWLEATHELGVRGYAPGRQDSSQQAGGEPQPVAYAVLPPALPVHYGTSTARVISVCPWFHSAFSHASFTWARGNLWEMSVWKGSL